MRNKNSQKVVIHSSVRDFLVNKGKKGLYGLYEDGKSNVTENSLDTLYDKTAPMTRCEFDNYLLKCIAEMSEFMTDTSDIVRRIREDSEASAIVNRRLVSEMRAEVDAMRVEVGAIKEIRSPDREDVYAINRKIEILANKLELLVIQIGKKGIIESLLSSAFPSERA